MTTQKTKKPILSDAEMQNVTSATAEVMREQDKIKVKLYLDPEEKQKFEAQERAGKLVQWPAEFVGVNGHNYLIHRGKEVEVPRSVYEVLENAGLV